MPPPTRIWKSQQKRAYPVEKYYFSSGKHRNLPRMLLVSVVIKAADFIPRTCLHHTYSVDFGIPYPTKAGKGMNFICVNVKRNATETVSQSIRVAGDGPHA